MYLHFLLAILVLCTHTHARFLSRHENGTVVFPQNELVTRAGNFYLRIMPLGASITKGDPTAPGLGGRGYRKFLRDQLRSKGWSVNMVGSQRWGDAFADNDNEGWPGYFVGPEDGTGEKNVHPKAKEFVPKYKPNLVLINCGTNDGNFDNDVANIGSRMEAMVRTVFSGSPGTVVILSTLLPSRDHDANMLIINEQYRALISKLQSQGFKIQLAEMHDGFLTMNDLISDGIHPTYDGAKKMASSWYKAIVAVEKKGWLSAPSKDVATPDDAAGNQQCEKTFKSGDSDPRSNVKLLCAGSGNIYDDGTYVHGSEQQEPFPFRFVRAPVAIPDRPLLYLAQVTTRGADRGGERDEFIWIEGHSDRAFFMENNGNGNFGDQQPLTLPGFNCITRGIRWGDVNNDGLADFICLAPDGTMRVGINEGGNPPVFRGVGIWKTAEAGYEQASVRLGDIDGDGRLDYCVLDGNINLRCWRSGGISRDKVDFWQDMGVVWTGATASGVNFATNEFRLVDINGDFKSDILFIDTTGRVTTWINQRGSDKSLKPFWRSAGVTHPGMGEEVRDSFDSIMFGRIYNDFKTDYVRWGLSGDGANVGLGYWLGGVRAWKQTGKGGTYPKGDGAAWGDMTGSGNDDYVWIAQNGDVVVFVNKNRRPGTDLYQNCAAWDDKGVVLKTGMNRKAIHIADWNGDGRADVIGVNKADGSLTVWLTTYNGGAFTFSRQTSPQGYCDKGWGVGTTDLGIRFADVTDSRCADVLCLDLDGRTSAWLNDCNGLWGVRNVGQIKAAVTPFKDRANIRFADVNGDGRADYMWVDKFTGDTEVWYNDGEVPEADRAGNLGSKIKWSGRGPTYSGSSRGQNMHFPNLGGVGRADMVHVEPQSAHGWVWFNSCPAGGDDGGLVPRDPEIPIYGALPVCPARVCYGPQDQFGNTWGCGMDPFADEFSDEDACNEGEQERSLEYDEETIYPGLAARGLVKRGEPREFAFNFTALGRQWALSVWSRGYPGSSHLHDPTRGPPAPDYVFQMNPGCTNFGVRWYLRTRLTRNQLIDGYDTEHNPDLQFMRDFTYTLGTGILPDGNRIRSLGVSPADLINFWNRPGLMRGAPRLGVSRCTTSPQQYFADRFGSQGYRPGMVLCERELNQMKGRVFDIQLPTGRPVQAIAPARFQLLLDASIWDLGSRNELFELLRQVIGVFNYINDPLALGIINQNRLNLQQAADEIATRVPALANVGQIFREFFPLWYQRTADLARTWLTDRLNDMLARYQLAESQGEPIEDVNALEQTIQAFFDALNQIRSPF